jgi:DNA-directed RNA polymerase specialized sigma24 family protein
MTLSKRETDKLLTDHLGYVRSRVIAHARRFGFLDFEDVNTECLIQLVKRASRFNPDKCPYAMFVDGTVKWTVARMVRAYNRRPPLPVDFDTDTEQLIDDCDDIESQIDISRRMEQMASSPVLRRRLIGHTLHEIGEEDGVARSTVLRREQAEIERLKMDADATTEPARVNIQESGDSTDVHFQRTTDPRRARSIPG